MTLIFFLTWTVYGFLASGIVVIYVELMLSCDKLEDTAGPLGLNDPHLCLPLATGLSEYLIDIILHIVPMVTLSWIIVISQQWV